MTSFLPTQYTLILISLITLCTSQTNDPIEDTDNWTLTWIWLMLIVNCISASIILLSLIYFIIKICNDPDSRHERASVIFQLLMSTFGILSCVAYALARPNIFINVHNEFDCRLAVYISLFSWAISRYFTLLFFLSRIWLVFTSSARIQRLVIIALGILFTMSTGFYIGVEIVVDDIYISVAIDNDEAEICMSEVIDYGDIDLFHIVSYSLDLVLVLVLLSMFIIKWCKLHKVRKYGNEIELGGIIDTTKSFGKYDASSTSGTKSSNTGSDKVKMELQLQEASSAESKKSVKTDLQKSDQTYVKELEKFVLKEVILLIIVIVTSWIIVGICLLDSRLGLFMGIDVLINVMASLFGFRYANRLWDGCLHRAGCYKWYQ